MARFRDLVRPTLVDVAARSTPTGADQAAQAIGQSLSSFSHTAIDLGGALATSLGAHQGEREGAVAGEEGTPEFKTGFAELTAYGQAYNNAALRSYAIRSEADMEETAARIEAEAGTDPEAFRSAMLEIRNGVIEQAPEEARAVLAQAYNRRMGSGLARIQTALVAELRAEDRQLVQEQVSTLTERVSHLRAQDTPEAHADSEREEAKLFMLIDAAIADGTISESEGRIYSVQAQRGIVKETVTERFRNEMNSPFGDPIGFIEDLKEMNRTAQVLPPEQEAELEATLLAELREANSLRGARVSQEAAEVDARYAAGDRAATSMLLAGELSQRDLLNMVLEDRITPAVGRTLLNELQSGDTAKSSPETLAHYELNLLSYTEDDILTEDGLTWSDRSSLIQKRRDEVTGWKGTQAAREAFDRIDRALGIVSGTPVQLLTKSELRARDAALTDLYDRVDALPPEERQSAVLGMAQQVIRDSIRTQASDELQTARQLLAETQQLRSEASTERDQRVLDQRIQQLENRVRELEVLQGQQ